MKAPSAQGWDAAWAEGLEALEGAGLLRKLRVVEAVASARIEEKGRQLWNFASNDYLGLAGEPRAREAAARAAMEWGGGSGASRLISGTLRLHAALEEALAAWKGTEAALTFSSGYATALGVIPALAGSGDVVILDKLAHACLVDGARLSGAKLRVFRHNDMEHLREHLEWAQSRQGADGKIWVVTESVFSMDGDVAPLREIVALKERAGAGLLVDEAHAVALFGENGAGLCQAEGVGAQVEVQMGTLSKALGASGGYVAGSRRLVDWLINKGRSFIFSTAPAPAAVAAALANLQIAQSAEGDRLRAELFERIGLWRCIFCAEGERSGMTPIQPVMAGEASRALDWMRQLNELGFWVPAVRFPTVPRGKARLRVSLSAAHPMEAVRALAEKVRGWAS
jgi:8-amino-7-oxononanoate synthase